MVNGPAILLSERLDTLSAGAQWHAGMACAHTWYSRASSTPEAYLVEQALHNLSTHNAIYVPLPPAVFN